MPENIEDMQYNPAFSSIYEDEEQDKQEFETWYSGVFQKLPLEKRLAISGKDATYETKKICRMFGVDDWRGVGYVARIIRDVFLGMLEKEKVKSIAMEKAGIQKEKLDGFIQRVEYATESIGEAGKKEYNETIEKIGLEKALEEYHNLPEMIITENPVKIEGENSLLPGTLQNWLNDYFQTMGGKKHDSFERNKYFLDSANIKKTDSTEKEKLAIILKVYDEEGLVAVDKKDQTINFEETKQINPKIFNLDDIMDSYDRSKGIGGAFSNNKKASQKAGSIKRMSNKPFFDSDGENKEAPEKIQEKADKKPVNQEINLKEKAKNLRKNRADDDGSRNDPNLIDLKE